MDSRVRSLRVAREIAGIKHLERASRTVDLLTTKRAGLSRRAVQLGVHETPIDTSTREIRPPHIPNVANPNIYTSAVLAMLAAADKDQKLLRDLDAATAMDPIVQSDSLLKDFQVSEFSAFGAFSTVTESMLDRHDPRALGALRHYLRDRAIGTSTVTFEEVSPDAIRLLGLGRVRLFPDAAMELFEDPRTALMGLSLRLENGSDRRILPGGFCSVHMIGMGGNTDPLLVKDIYFKRSTGTYVVTLFRGSPISGGYFSVEIPMGRLSSVLVSRAYNREII